MNNKERNLNIKSILNGYLLKSDFIQFDNVIFYSTKEELLKAIEKELRGM